MPTATMIHPEAANQSQASPFVSRVTPPEPFTIVLFGATGDLAGRKLLPALHSLWHRKFMPDNFAILGVGRREKTNAAFRDEALKDLTSLDKADESHAADAFFSHLHYQSADFTTAEGMRKLAERLKQVEAERNLPGNRLYYLATDPNFFSPVVEGLASAGLVRREVDRPWTRVVIEKPFGHDLQSALALDRQLLVHL